MRFWLKIICVLLLIWGVVGGIMHWANSSQPTAESIKAFLARTDMAGIAGKRRAAAIEELEEMLNRVSFDERQKLQRERVTMQFVRQLTPEEQGAFLDATLPAGFKQLMESFNKMEPKRRKDMVDRALAEMKKHEGEGPPRDVDSKLRQRMIDQGMRSFYNDASAEVKLDMAPLIEQMQRNLQSVGQ